RPAVGLRRRPGHGADGVHRDLVRRAAGAGVRQRARPRDGPRRHARQGVGVPARQRPLPDRGRRPRRAPPVPARAGLRRMGRPGRPPAGQRQRPPLRRLRLLRLHRRADHPGGDAMSAAGIVGAAVQVALVAAGAPLLVGVMRQVRARMEGRAGAGVGQPWRDLRKLLRKEPIAPRGTGLLFRAAPLVLASTALVVSAVIPIVTTESPLDGAADLFAVIALLALGTVFLALAGLDTATAFGGMGASREMVVLALVEPTILLSVFAVSARVGSTNLGEIVTTTLDDPQLVVSPVSLLAAVALAIVTIAETGRIPVDN